ncbi:MAG TPA: signal peptidase II [Candidatus Polarisedimenticolia bacterium]
MSHRAARYLPYIAAGLAVVGLDRITKSLVLTSLVPAGSVPVIPGLFDLTFVRNPGGVFGLFRSLDAGWRGLLFTVMPAAAILLIGLYAARVPAHRKVTLLALSLILGGALGNLLDRFKYGHVIDFLDFYWREHHWPAFNVADSAICVGVGLLIGESLFGTESPAPEGGAEPPSPVEPSRESAP